MKRIVLLLFMSALLHLAGCSTKTKSDYTVVTISPEVFETAVELSDEKVEFFDEAFTDSLLYARRFFVFQDTILIVENKPNSECPFFEVFDLHSKQCITKFLSRGEGHSEAILIETDCCDTFLVVRDIIRNRLGKIGLNSILQGDSIDELLSHYEYDCQSASYYGDNIIFKNPFFFDNDDLDIHQGESKLIIGTYETKDSTIYEWDTYNVGFGEIIPNPIQSKIIYASNDSPILEIYDGNLNLLKIIKILVDWKIDYYVNDNELVYRRTIPECYREACFNDNEVILSYIGQKTLEAESLPTWLFKFDWDGNLLNTYHFNGTIRSMSMGLDGSTVFITTLNEDMEPVLAKLHL